MQPGERSTDYIFQGSVYFYRREKVYCRFQAAFVDSVSLPLLQQALDAVLARAEYFRVQLLWEKEQPCLIRNENPCRVRSGSRQPEMPEETDGYLFALSCEGNWVYFDWYHFLTDGRGVSRFLTQIMMEYANRRYGTDFEGSVLVSDPPYSVEELAERYRAGKIDNDLRSESTQTHEGTLRRSLVRIRKEDLLRRAEALGAKPFSVLLAVMGRAAAALAQRERVSYTYSIDTRVAMGCPGALYNCVASFRDEAAFQAASPLTAGQAGQVDAGVRSHLDPESLRTRMAQQWGFVYEVNRMRAPLKIRKRVFQMGEYASGIPSDFWLSYIGDPIATDRRQLDTFLTDYQVWVPPEGASFAIEEVTLNGVMSLCIQDKTERPEFLAILSGILAEEGMPPLSAEWVR